MDIIQQKIKIYTYNSQEYINLCDWNISKEAKRNY